jgi:hypothetical protein
MVWVGANLAPPPIAIPAMQTILSIARADWAPTIRAAAYRVAYVVAVLVVLADFTYRAGLATGRAIHWLSDRIAGLASGRIDRAQTARAVASWAHSLIDPPTPPAVVVMACAAAPSAPVAVSPPSLDSLTVAELRKMARARGLTCLARKGRRADLLSALG